MADLNVVLSAIIMFETLELIHKLLRHSNGRSSGGGPANETQEKQRNNDKSTEKATCHFITLSHHNLFKYGMLPREENL